MKQMLAVIFWNREQIGLDKIKDNFMERFKMLPENAFDNLYTVLIALIMEIFRKTAEGYTMHFMT